ncbi:MAG: hypothetical protein IJB75_03000 [Oscillospiraceae bacterium]|nr:hypothetical protein [Oscillospiraceae bacterium]
MWISQQGRCAGKQGHDARTAVVTAQGEQAGVYMDGHQRWLPVAAPGGYRWKPRTGQQVIVIKSGADAEATYILAQKEAGDCDLKPGEVELYGNGCSVKLDAEGRVHLQGTLVVNGTALESLIDTAVSRALNQREGK